MKRKALITSALILCCWACCGFFCTTEWDLYQPCGLVVDMTPPKNADSVHVSIYNDKEVYFELRDELIRPKSNPSDTFRWILRRNEVERQREACCLPPPLLKQLEKQQEARKAQTFCPRYKSHPGQGMTCNE